MRKLISKELILNMKNFMIEEGAKQRSIADSIEHKVKTILMTTKMYDIIKETLEPRGSKSIEDVTIVGKNDMTFYVDTKTHNVNRKFSMPNLTSVEKLRNLFSHYDTELIYVFVSYSVSDNYVNLLSFDVKYIWEIDVDCLRVGALGLGQLQIKDKNKPLKFVNISKLEWFNKLKTMVNIYHKKQIESIKKEMVKWV
jgi:hypothetical protein